MVWVYERTNGSLLVAMLMHASYTVCTFTLNALANPGMMSGASLMVYGLVSAAALWVVAALAVAARGHLSRQPPLQRRVAYERRSPGL